MNEQNLRTPTTSEAREIGQKGGLASGEARRHKRNLRIALELLLEKDITDDAGEIISGAEALAAALFEKALKGDVRAFEVIRATVGQDPVRKAMVAEVDPEVIVEVDLAVSNAEQKEPYSK